VLELAESQLEKIEFDAPHGVCLLEYQQGVGATEGKKGNWFMQSPGQGNIQPKYGDQIQKAILSLKADGYAPEGSDLNSLGLEEPELTITVTYKQDSRQLQCELVLSQDRDGYRYMMKDRNTSLIYKVPSYPFHIFLKEVEKLLDPP